MRENRTHGSEGGESQLNATSLPLFGCRREATEKLIIRKYKIGSNSILDWHSNYAEAEIVVEPGFCRLFNI